MARKDRSPLTRGVFRCLTPRQGSLQRTLLFGLRNGPPRQSYHTSLTFGTCEHAQVTK